MARDGRAGGGSVWGGDGAVRRTGRRIAWSVMMMSGWLAAAWTGSDGWQLGTELSLSFNPISGHIST